MVSKKNFPQSNRPMAYRKQFFSQIPDNSGQKIFQIPDNPGYVDFNNMDFNQPAAIMGDNSQNSQKKKSQKGKPKNKPQNLQQQRQNGGNSWKRNNQQQMLGPSLGPNKFRPNSQRIFPPMPNNSRIRMIPPMPPIPHGFQCPPMMMPPMPHPMRPMRPNPMGVMPPNAPPFLRRSARRPQGNGQGGVPFKKQIFPGHMPPMLSPMPPMMVGRPPIPRMPMPFNVAVMPNVGKVKKPNPKIVKKIVKGKSTIKTLKNLQNQYPIDKPWVTDEIRVEHEKKIEIENKLKGKKDDDLFAQFKTQRDKFVGMYETARDEYLKKEAAQVKTKDVNGKQANNKTAGKSGKGNEINEKTNA